LYLSSRESKESGGNVEKIQSVVSRTKDVDFKVIAGSAGFFLPALKVGAVGCIPALGNILGEAICNLHKEYLNGNCEAAEKSHESLQAVNMAVTKQFGVPGLKCAMEWFGYRAGKPRPPLLPLDDENRAKLREICQPFLN
jgi:4-hydroxy-2-oxoglutarate aldolase